MDDMSSESRRSGRLDFDSGLDASQVNRSGDVVGRNVQEWGGRGRQVDAEDDNLEIFKKKLEEAENFSSIQTYVVGYLERAEQRNIVERNAALELILERSRSFKEVDLGIQRALKISLKEERFEELKQLKDEQAALMVVADSLDMFEGVRQVARAGQGDYLRGKRDADEIFSGAVGPNVSNIRGSEKLQGMVDRYQATAVGVWEWAKSVAKGADYEGRTKEGLEALGWGTIPFRETLNLARVITEETVSPPETPPRVGPSGGDPSRGPESEIFAERARRAEELLIATGLSNNGLPTSIAELDAIEQGAPYIEKTGRPLYGGILHNLLNKYMTVSVTEGEKRLGLASKVEANFTSDELLLINDRDVRFWVQVFAFGFGLGSRTKINSHLNENQGGFVKNASGEAPMQGRSVGEMLNAIAGRDVENDERMWGEYRMEAGRRVAPSKDNTWNKAFGNVQYGEWEVLQVAMMRAIVLRGNPEISSDELDTIIRTNKNLRMGLAGARMYAMATHMGDQFAVESKHFLATAAYFEFHFQAAAVDRLAKLSLPHRFRSYMNLNSDLFKDSQGNWSDETLMHRRLFAPDVMRSVICSPAVFSRGVQGPNPEESRYEPQETILDLAIRGIEVRQDALQTGVTPTRIYSFGVNAAEKIFNLAFGGGTPPEGPDVKFDRDKGWAWNMGQEILATARDLGWIMEYENTIKQEGVSMTPAEASRRRRAIEHNIQRLGITRFMAGLGMRIERGEVHNLTDLAAWAVGMVLDRSAKFVHQMNLPDGSVKQLEFRWVSKEDSEWVVEHGLNKRDEKWVDTRSPWSYVYELVTRRAPNRRGEWETKQGGEDDLLIQVLVDKAGGDASEAAMHRRDQLNHRVRKWRWGVGDYFLGCGGTATKEDVRLRESFEEKIAGGRDMPKIDRLTPYQKVYNTLDFSDYGKS